MTDAASFSLLFWNLQLTRQLICVSKYWLDEAKEGDGMGLGSVRVLQEEKRGAASTDQECVLIPDRRGAVFVHSVHP